jgi:uncharacterized protein YjdB
MRSAHVVVATSALALLAALPGGARAATLVSLTISPPVLTARALVDKQFQAVGSYDDGSQKDLTRRVSWRSSDETVASVVETTGLVETLGAGTAKIVATAVGGVQARARVYVTADLIGLAVKPGDITLRGGTGRTLGVVGSFSDGGKAHLRTGIVWTSSDETVATVGNVAAKRGLVVAGAVRGSTTVTVTAAAPPGATPLSASAVVTVDTLLTSFRLSPSTLNVRVGKTTHLSAIGTFDDGKHLDITRFVDFASSDPTIAIAANRPRKNGRGVGEVDGIRVGTVQITATSPSTEIQADGPLTVHVK